MKDDTFLKMIRDIQKAWKPFRELHRLYESPLQQISQDLLDKEKLLNDLAFTVQERHQSLAQLAQIELEKYNEIESLSKQMTEVSNATAIISDSFEKQDFLSQDINDFVSTSRYWHKEIEMYSNSHSEAEASQLALDCHYNDVIEAALIAQKRAELLNWDNIGTSIGIPSEMISPAVHSFSDLLETYHELFRSLNGAEHKFASLPPFASKFPPVEIITSSNFLRTISREETPQKPVEDVGEIEEIESHINEEIEASPEELLDQAVPSLVPLWEGAKQSLTSDNPDRHRHTIVSLREIVTHLLHHLAPDEDIRSWTTDDSLYHEGRPTRRARLLFICRDLNHGPFQVFLEKDVSAHIELIQILQRGTHKLDIELTQEQLSALVIKTGSLIRFILVVWSSN